MHVLTSSSKCSILLSMFTTTQLLLRMFFLVIVFICQLSSLLCTSIMLNFTNIFECLIVFLSLCKFEANHGHLPRTPNNVSFVSMCIPSKWASHVVGKKNLTHELRSSFKDIHFPLVVDHYEQWRHLWHAWVLKIPCCFFVIKFT